MLELAQPCQQYLFLLSLQFEILHLKLIYKTGCSWLISVNRPFYRCVLSYLAMNAREAEVDLALIQTSLLFSCKYNLVSIRTT